MISPPRLNQGDIIGIVSPAKKIDEALVLNGVEIIRKLGYRVKLGKHVLATDNYFAGTDLQRSSDFQTMLDDPEVKMILCSRGGYGSARIIDSLDFTKFIESPKWIAGYSDITVFHSHLYNLGFETLHSIMPLDFRDNGEISKPVVKLFEAASGESPEYQLRPYKLNKQGSAQGDIIGGNLSILCSILGSDSDFDFSDKILFIEEVGEDLYRIDRMMNTLKRFGKLQNLAGMIVGGLTGMSPGNPDFGKTAEEIILNNIEEFDFPVAFGFPAGHFAENYPIIIGRKIQIEVGGENVELRM